MTNKIQRFLAFLLVLCIPIFAIAGCTNKDVANAANHATSSANGAYSIDTKTTTPEGKLEYREEVHCQIKNMLVHQVQTPRGIQRKTFAQDVASLDGWYLPIKVKVTDIGCPEDFSNELVDEVEMFSFPATLSIFTCM